jgi:hypothetical protein
MGHGADQRGYLPQHHRLEVIRKSYGPMVNFETAQSIRLVLCHIANAPGTSATKSRWHMLPFFVLVRRAAAPCRVAQRCVRRSAVHSACLSQKQMGGCSLTPQNQSVDRHLRPTTRVGTPGTRPRASTKRLGLGPIFPQSQIMT